MLLCLSQFWCFGKNPKPGRDHLFAFLPTDQGGIMFTLPHTFFTHFYLTLVDETSSSHHASSGQLDSPHAVSRDPQKKEKRRRRRREAEPPCCLFTFLPLFHMHTCHPPGPSQNTFGIACCIDQRGSSISRAELTLICSKCII